MDGWCSPKSVPWNKDILLTLYNGTIYTLRLRIYIHTSFSKGYRYRQSRLRLHAYMPTRRLKEATDTAEPIWSVSTGCVTISRSGVIIIIL